MLEDEFDNIYVQDMYGMIQVDSSNNASKVGVMMDDDLFHQAMHSRKIVIILDKTNNSKQVVAPIMAGEQRYGVVRISYSLNDIVQKTKNINEQLAGNVTLGMENIINKLLISTFIVIVIAFIFGWLILRSILHPVSRLTSGVQHAATGNLGYRIPIEVNDSVLPTTKDELTILTHAFNQMLDDLEKQRSDLVKSNEKNDHLRKYLDNIYNSMPSILIGVDPQGIVTRWNLEAEKKTGITALEAKDKTIKSLLPRLAEELKNIKLAVAGRRVQSCEKIITQQNGSTLYEDITIYPLIANGIDGAVIRIDDVTERVRLEDMMIQTEKMMSVGGLAAGMAHEINNPLAVILQNLQVLELYLLKDSPKNGAIAKECRVDLQALHGFMEKRDIRTIIKSVLDAGVRAKKIVANMLSFSRKSDQGIKPCDMVPLIEQTIELAGNDYDLKKKFDFKKITIIRDYKEQLSPVLCETGQIQQVLLNLLKNSAQAMAKTITLRLLTNQNMVHLEVEDDGPGMDAETQKRIFEPFFTTKEPGLGTGLGLSVSYFIVCDTHGGTLTVRSQKGVGTTFDMGLPIAG